MANKEINELWIKLIKEATRSAAERRAERRLDKLGTIKKETERLKIANENGYWPGSQEAETIIKEMLTESTKEEQKEMFTKEKEAFEYLYKFEYLRDYFKGYKD